MNANLLRKVGVDLNKIPVEYFVKIRKKTYVCITCINGTKQEINPYLLTADIFIPSEYFGNTKITVKRKELKPVKSSGLFVDYDLMYSKNPLTATLRSFLDLNYFFGSSIFKNSVVYFNSEEEQYFRRVDTTLSIEDIDDILRFEIGDITANDVFTNSYLRAGGIKISKDFSLRPDIITYPLPDFAGSTALPSTIDIVIKNATVFSKDIKPGAFEIKDIPVISPEGKMRVIIKDILGREQIVEIPYITSTKLLKENLDEYSVSAGFQRKNYLLKDFDYSKFIFTGFYRRGLTNHLTAGVSSYFEGKNKGYLGFGTDFVNKLGLFSPKFAISYDGELRKSGYMYGLDYSKSLKFLNLSFQYQKGSSHFLQPLSTFGRIKEQFAGRIGLPIPYIGNFNLSYIYRDYYENTTNKNLNITYSRRIINNISLTATYNKNIADSTYEVYSLYMSMPLGSSHTGSLKYQSNKKTDLYGFEIQKNQDSGSKGIGYSVKADKYNGTNRYEGRFNWNAEYLSAYTDFSYYKSDLFYRLGIEGSVIYIDNNFYFRRGVTNSFGIVKIDPPVKDAEVIVNNRPVGKTNKEGMLFITALAPYHENEVKINPESLDIKTFINKNIYSFIPYKNHGYILKFNSKKANAVRLKVILPDGEMIPAGTRFDIDGNKNVGIVGFKGKTYIENITSGKHEILIDYGYGKCKLELDVDEKILEGVIPFIGEYKCQPIKVNDSIIVKKKETPILHKKTIKETAKKSIKKPKEIKKHKKVVSIKKQPELKKTGIVKETVPTKTFNLDDFDDLEEFFEFRESLRLN